MAVTKPVKQDLSRLADRAAPAATGQLAGRSVSAFGKWPFRMHPERKSGTQQQQANRAGKGQGPASGTVDQIAEHDGETRPATPKPKFIMPLAVPAYRGAISIGTAQIGATISSRKRTPRRGRPPPREVVDQDHRKQEHKAAQQAGDDDVAPRRVPIAGTSQDAVADHAAQRVADHAGQENAGRIERRLLQVRVIILKKNDGIQVRNSQSVQP